MKTFKTRLSGFALTVLAGAAVCPAATQAATILATSDLAASNVAMPIFHVGGFVGTKMFLSKAKNISSGHGTVLTYNDISIATKGKSDFANGYALITPAGGEGEDSMHSDDGCGDGHDDEGCGKLTDVKLTPISGSFIGFSFRGQVIDCNQDIYVTVQDAQGDPSQTFAFKVHSAHDEFKRLSILTSLRNKTIKWVEIQTGGGFEKVDQINWLTQGSQTPEPATWALMVMGLGGLGGALRRKRQVAAI